MCGTIFRMNDVLSKLFGSEARVKILRLFLSNLDTKYSTDDVCKRAKTHIQTTKKELSLFLKIGLLKKTTAYEIEPAKGKQKKDKKKKVIVYTVDQNFKDLTALRNLILNIAPTDEKGISQSVSGVGKIKLLVIAGEFIQDPDSRVDILVVGDALKEAKLKSAIGKLESHIGRELRYAVFTTQDFTYRLGIYDKLLRDVLDYPHKIIVDKLPVGWKEVHMRKKSDRG